jgi:RecG-like helicase
MLEDGERSTLILTVILVEGGNVVKAECKDEEGNSVILTWFYGNTEKGKRAAFGVVNMLGGYQRGERKRVVGGKIRRDARGRFEIVQPDFVKPMEELESLLKVEPVYGLTRGLTGKRMKKAVDEAMKDLERVLEVTPESMPKELREAMGWQTLMEAFREAHNPRNMEVRKDRS